MLDLLLMLLFALFAFAGIFRGFSFFTTGDVTSALSWFGLAGVSAIILAVLLLRPWARKGTVGKKSTRGFLDFFSIAIVVICGYYTVWYAVISVDLLISGVFVVIAVVILALAKPWRTPTPA